MTKLDREEGLKCYHLPVEQFRKNLFVSEFHFPTLYIKTYGSYSLFLFVKVLFIYLSVGRG